MRSAVGAALASSGADSKQVGVKEHVVRVWQKHQADAVRLLRAVGVSKGQRILEQFKTPEEIDTMHQLLEQLRLQGTEELTAGSGTTSGDARPLVLPCRSTCFRF